MKNDSSHYGLTFLCTIGRQLNTDSNDLKGQKKSIIRYLIFDTLKCRSLI